MLKLNISITVSAKTLGTINRFNRLPRFCKELAETMKTSANRSIGDIDVSIYWHTHEFAHNAPDMHIEMEFARDNASSLVSEAEFIAMPITLYAFMQRHVDIIPKEVKEFELYSTILDRRIIQRLPLRA